MTAGFQMDPVTVEAGGEGGDGTSTVEQSRSEKMTSNIEQEVVKCGDNMTVESVKKSEQHTVREVKTTVTNTVEEVSAEELFRRYPELRSACQTFEYLKLKSGLKRGQQKSPRW